MNTIAKQQIRPETWGFVAVLLIANFMLLLGRICEPLIFFPSQWISGDWWRALTFPFVHVSWYHLLMDAGAFLFLYHSLQEPSMRRRLLTVAACAAGSLGVSLLVSPLDNGLCGLSGVAHGLMAVSALEIMKSSDKTLRNAGIICFLAVALKSIYEACAGTIAFDFLHFGPVGKAVAVCHAGGVLGGVFAYGFCRRKKESL